MTASQKKSEHDFDLEPDGLLAIPPVGIYEGVVFHKRFRPRLHTLSYSVFAFWIDPANMARLASKHLLVSHNRFNLFSIHDSDFGRGAPLEYLQDIKQTLNNAGETREISSVRLLCYPRILGYAFNPICVYYCYEDTGRLLAMVYEVNNTFGERTSYPFLFGRCAATHERAQGFVALHSCRKSMHVSPFTPMDIHYQFKALIPSDRLSVAIRLFNEKGTMLTASFNARKRQMTTNRLLRNFLLYPFMTFKVTGGIHWEALKLWVKKIPVYRHTRMTS